MKQKGLRVIAITSPGLLAKDFATREEIEVKLIPMTREISPAKDLISLLRIIKVLRKIRPQIVQGSTPKAAFLTLFAAWLLRIPVRVFFMRGLRFTGLNGWRYWIVRSMEQLTCLFAHRVLCTSKSVRELAITYKICSPIKAKVLHYGTANGIDVNQFNPDNYSEEAQAKLRQRLGIPPRCDILLFVGRIVRDKGIVELYHAWQILRVEYPDLYLIIAGSEEPEDPIPPQIIKGFKKDKQVKMIGFVQDTAPFYAISTLLVLPTYREGIPIAALEASAMGLPVVATRVTGCVDAVVDGITGILVPPRDPEKLAEGIRKYLDDPDLRFKHGKAGRKRVIKYFSPQVIWQALYQEYIDLLIQKGQLKEI